MARVKLKKVGNSFEKLLAPILSLENEKVEVGHFQEQGEHYSGYTYPELMKIHHYGMDPTGGVEIPPRPVLDYLFFNNMDLQDPKIKRVMRAWGRREPSEQSNAQLLEDLGKILAKKEKEIFGKTPPLIPNAPGKNPSNPLILTGDLSERTAHRNTKSKTIKEV